MTIVVPVHGFAVPFHINTIKNVSKLDEGEFTYLRINFQSPGQLTGRKEDTVSQKRLLCMSPVVYIELFISHSKIQMQPLFVP
jgi:nucleosome binding factor SPN SPT16 subunit